MKFSHFKLYLILSLYFLGLSISHAQTADKIMIVIIDGARYTETFGDPNHTYVPQMYNLSKQGTLIDNYKNNNYTYTSRAIPALWCGAWTDVQSIVYNGSSTQYAVLPSIFEYYRKQKSMPANECFYILPYISSLWLPSFDGDYGPSYWPEFHSVGNSDKDVATQAQLVMENSHPHFMLVYLPDVDHAGHSGIWSEYTQAISTADSIVNVLWQKLQSDPFYKESTTLIVTNDHGRHDDDHGGFQGHGCSCEGCRHIQFLALGPSIKKDYVSSTYRTIPDMAVTASYLLGIEPTKATGNVMQEIFDLTGTQNEENQPITLVSSYPNPFVNRTSITYFLSKPSQVKLSIINIAGEEVITLANEWENQGEQSIVWNARNNQGQKVSPGIYFYRLQVGDQNKTGKIILADDSK